MSLPDCCTVKSQAITYFRFFSLEEIVINNFSPYCNRIRHFGTFILMEIYKFQSVSTRALQPIYTLRSLEGKLIQIKII